VEEQAQRWALQRLLRAGEAVYRQADVFALTHCEPCVGGLVCTAHV
jgi:hypothetical protein